MKPDNSLTSACRYCQYYAHEGRRGGLCQQLDVPVEANWKSCSISVPAFSHAWENISDIVFLENSLSQVTQENTSTTTSEKIFNTKFKTKNLKPQFKTKVHNPQLSPQNLVHKG